jgi:hypothetical protein
MYWGLICWNSYCMDPDHNSFGCHGWKIRFGTSFSAYDDPMVSPKAPLTLSQSLVFSQVAAPGTMSLYPDTANHIMVGAPTHQWRNTAHDM